MTSPADDIRRGGSRFCCEAGVARPSASVVRISLRMIKSQAMYRQLPDSAEYETIYRESFLSQQFRRLRKCPPSMLEELNAVLELAMFESTAAPQGQAVAGAAPDSSVLKPRRRRWKTVLRGWRRRL
ncbi:hypothetical protein LTR37_000248 [Vermiconidia calcicola]|uniref:Uncharacterized protein n=1 Tax=Vermiconidia calcicola TaxID=1690605 RepID=A0ACC3NZA8_9PEZI|nr:hypothetical protein LTR37_000248 [Vermiconidia calcicola]